MKESVIFPAGPGEWDPGDRAIAHIDMDAFYASVEILDFPEFAGVPLVVGGSSNRGVVAAASYEARKYGIHSAMPIFEARRRCPSIVIRPGRMRRYVELSQEAMNVLHGFSPLVEQISIDEAYIDLTGTARLFGSPPDAVRRIREGIAAATGLTCSVGLSGSKLVSKIASDFNKPDGVAVVPPGVTSTFLDALSVSKIPGVGGKGAEALSRFGISKVADIGRHSPERILERFGRFGERLLAIAAGELRSEIVPWSQPKSVSSETTMPKDTDDPAVLERQLIGLADRVGRRLRRQGLAGRTVTLKLKTHRHRSMTRSVTIEKPTSLGKTIYGKALGLLREQGIPCSMRLIGVGVSGLEPAGEGGQYDLFSGGDGESDRWDRVERALDRITDRFGSEAVRRGRELESE